MPLTLAAGVSIRPIADQGYEVGRGDVFFKLDEPAALVLTLFDGRRDASALRAEAARRGLPVSARAIDGLLRALVGEGLLVDVAELPVEPLPDTSVACARCGYCCHLSIGPLSAADVQRMEALDWAAHGQEAPSSWLRSDSQGDTYLAQGADDACVFLDPDGLCRVHKVFGEAAKPDPCRLFPLVALRRAGRVRVGLTYECPGLERAATEGAPVAQEVARLADVVRRSLEDYAVLPDLDPSGILWGGRRRGLLPGGGLGRAFRGGRRPLPRGNPRRGGLARRPHPPGHRCPRSGPLGVPAGRGGRRPRRPDRPARQDRPPVARAGWPALGLRAVAGVPWRAHRPFGRCGRGGDDRGCRGVGAYPPQRAGGRGKWAALRRESRYHPGGGRPVGPGGRPVGDERSVSEEARNHPD